MSRLGHATPAVALRYQHATLELSKISQSRSSSLSLPLERYARCEHSIDMKTGLSVCVLVTEGENGPKVHR